MDALVEVKEDRFVMVPPLFRPLSPDSDTPTSSPLVRFGDFPSSRARARLARLFRSSGRGTLQASSKSDLRESLSNSGCKAVVRKAGDEGALESFACLPLSLRFTVCKLGLSVSRSKNLGPSSSSVETCIPILFITGLFS